MDTVALSSIDRDCASLGGLFQSIVHELKGSPPVWEEFISKATKLHHQLKATILATGAFLDCFQKVADMATSSKGSTREIGSALTRLCMRHRNLEAKLKQFSSSIMDCLVGPLQEKIPDWKTTSLQLDKDHAKEYKRLRADIKRVNSETTRLEKKYKKSAGRGDVAKRLELSRQELSDKYIILEENEKAAVRQAMIEERSRFCLFVSYIKPVMDEEVSMITEVSHLQEIVESLVSNSNDPFTLPKSSEQIIHDMKGQDSTVWAPFHSTPPSSPSSIGSRKSSVCSISSFNSISSGSTTGTGSGVASNLISNGYPSSPQNHATTANDTLAQTGNAAASSSAPVARRSNSQDSGFTSQDTLFLKPQGLTPPVNWKQGEDSPPVLSTFLPVPEGSSSTTTGTPPDFLLHSHSTLKRKTATSFRDPLQPSPPPPLSLNTPIPQSPRHQRKHPPTPPSVPPPPTPDSESNTPTPTSMSQPQFPSQATSHYQTPSSPPRMRAFPHDNSFKKKSTAPPVAPPPPPPRYSPVTSQPPASTPALQTTQDGYALPQNAASRTTNENDGAKIPTTSSSPSSASSNSSSTPSSPYPSAGEASHRTHPLEGLAPQNNEPPPSLASTTTVTPATPAAAGRPASDDGYNSGGALSQNHVLNSSFGSTQSTTPPPSTLPYQGGFHRRGSTVSMPAVELESGSMASYGASSSPQKPPIPDKPPPIARKPSLKPALKSSPCPATSSVTDFNQSAPHQVIPQPVLYSPSNGDGFGDPYATLKANRSGSKRSLAKDMQNGSGDHYQSHQQLQQQQLQQYQQPEPQPLTRNDSETSLTEALNRSLLMATQAMEELSAMTVADAENQTRNHRPPSGLSQGVGYEVEKGSSRSPTPSSGTLRRNSSLSANRPPPPVRRTSSLSQNADQNSSQPSRSMAPPSRGITVTRSQSVVASDVSHAPPTAVSASGAASIRGGGGANGGVGGGGGGGGGGDEGTVARGRSALMESLNAKLGGGSPQAKLVPVHPKSLGQRDPSPSVRPANLPQQQQQQQKQPQPFTLQPHPYAHSSASNTRPAPPPPPPAAQHFANAGLASGGGTGLLGTDDLRNSLLSEIKAAGGSGSRGLRRVRPEGVNDRSAPRIN